MITFNSFVNKEKKWEVYLKGNDEIFDMYYEDEKPEEGMMVHGLTEFSESKIYINDRLEGFVLIKTLRHELLHVYLYEIDKRDIYYSEDEVCEILSEITPWIYETADEIVSKLKK